MTTFSTWRDGVDSWVIHGETEGGLHFELPFYSEESRNEAWRILESEDLGDKFLYGRPGLLGYESDNLRKASAYARQIEAEVLQAERAGL